MSTPERFLGRSLLATSKMNDSSKRRSNSVEHRSTKRRKPNSEHRPIYSTRQITWEEQLTLPPRFHEDKDVWPASKILQERGPSRKKEYLLEWEAHPRTGEIFEPSWEPSDNVGEELKQAWKVATLQESQSTPQESSPVVPARSRAQPTLSKLLTGSRRFNNRRIIPDSSAEEVEEVAVSNSVASRTPTLTGSPGSADSFVSPLEISETQQQRLPASVRVNVPPAPSDKGDWESLRGSQFSQLGASNHPVSPLTNSLASSASSQQRRSSGLAARSPDPPSASSVRSSPRLRSSLRRAEGRGPQRILDYQSENGVASPTAESIPSSEVQTQQSTSGNIVHGSSSRVSFTRSGAADLSNFSSSHILEGRLSGDPRNTLASGSERSRNSASVASSGRQNIQPWAFQTQIPLESQSTQSSSFVGSSQRSSLSGRAARKTNLSSASQHPKVSFADSQNSGESASRSPGSGMAARGTRQSPRLQTTSSLAGVATPRIAVRTNSYRKKANFNPPEHSSPLAATAELAESDSDFMTQDFPGNSFIEKLLPEQTPSNMSAVPPTSIAPSAMHIDPTEPAIMSALSQASSGYDVGLNTLPTPIRDSIEEEILSPVEDTSLESKASSSQESLRNERPVPQVDGLVMPSYPILGSDEYAIALPAEGKVQAIYTQTIKVKRKAILRFIRQRGSVNTAGTSATKTIVRNEMIELIGRLNDTTTHIDLGLPGIPTQYTIPSQEHAAYAEYAGSKFVFLGHLMDYFQRRDCTIVVMAKSGPTQDLLEEYLIMKKARVQRHERTYSSQQDSQSQSTGPTIELISTRPTEVVKVDSRPNLIIAFDASFDAFDPQVKSLRAQSIEPVPIVHLLVTNSSEHVDRCLPVSMPSPIRLRLLVRATYQAQMNLGGNPTIIRKPSDDVEGRPMDLGDINRAVRKSPNRKLEMVAAVVANATLSDDFASHWTLSSMPELALEELEESPLSASTVSTTPGRSRIRSQTPLSRGATQVRTRSRTPLSRAGTPSARKRQLEVEPADLVVKRQRTTPINEHVEPHEPEAVPAREQELLRMIDSLKVELANEKHARETAESARMAADSKATEWHTALAILQRRYEKRTQKSHQQQKENRTLTIAADNSKQRAEKLMVDNANLRQQVSQHKKDLELARNDLKAVGGDIAALEVAREEGRNAAAKAASLEKSLESVKRDFDFVRSQYQDTSNKAASLGSQVINLEAQAKILTQKASDERRRLKELNFVKSTEQNHAKISQLEAEKKSIQVRYKKLEEDNKLLKRNRGVQTRGSSVAPGSPGPRSRQGSPALAPPSGSRASVLRHER